MSWRACILAAVLASGCCPEHGRTARVTLVCPCGRVVYDGPGEYDGRCPVPWPLGHLSRCDPADCQERRRAKGLDWAAAEKTE